MAKAKKKTLIGLPSLKELGILNVLWNEGPGNVREVRDCLGISDADMQYTTTLKQLQMMEKKGLVKVDRSRVPHVYRVVVTREKILKPVVRSILDNVCDGSLADLMTVAFMVKTKPTDDELRNILAVVEEMMDRSRQRAKKK